MARLDPAAAHPAAADLDLKAGHQRQGGRQLLDVLGRHPLQGQLTAAARAARRQPHRDDLVDVLGRTAVGAGAVGRAGPPPRPLGVGRGVTLGERSGLALGHPAQRLHLTAQPFVDLLEPFALGPQPLVLDAQPLAFGLQPLLLFAQRGVLVLKPGDAPAQPVQTSRPSTRPGTSRLPRHEARRLQHRIRRQGPAISLRPAYGSARRPRADSGLGHIGATIQQTAPDHRGQQRSVILPAQKP
jgi:hypothetical protein